MRESKKVLLLILVLIFGFASVCSAALVNYDRRARRAGNPPPPPPPAAPAKARKKVNQPKKVVAPQWVRSTIEARTREERRYDTNRDGILQIAEIKVLLSNVVRNVARGETVRANNSYLKGYDLNRNKKIDFEEVSKIRQDVLDF